MPLSVKRAYCLQLANGHGWNLIATEGAESWLDCLASIMELRPCGLDGHPRIILTRDEIGEEKYGEPVYAFDPDIRRHLPGSGWKVKDRAFSSDGVRIRFWCHSEVPDVIYYIGEGEAQEKHVMRMWNLTYFISQREQFFGGFPFHAGLIELNGKGMLLAADGGTGKSTCCSRIPSPWHSPADDQMLIVRDNQRRYFTHPFPTWSEYIWKNSGRTWNAERYVPLSAVFFLQRAEDDNVIPLEQIRSAVLINEYAMQGCIMGKIALDKEGRLLLSKRIFNNACELAKTIPAYILEVSLHGEFWKEIERVL